MYDLVKAGYYDNNAFFRVVPDFVGNPITLTVVQFGIAPDPGVTSAWNNQKIVDDEGVDTYLSPVRLSNTRGVVSFAAAGPNTRTTQLFFNLRDNRGLDDHGNSS